MLAKSPRVLGIVVSLVLVATATARSSPPRDDAPLTEGDITRLVVTLKVRAESVAGIVRSRGVAFVADDAAVARLERAGVPAPVLEAVREQSRAPVVASPSAVTFDQVVEMVKLGVPEPDLREVIKGNVFTLGKDQVDQLRKLGASEALLKDLGAARAIDPAREIANLAILLDCSGSMGEATPDGSTKMDAARKAAVELIRTAPDGLHVSFVVYGHDRALRCEAVKVVRPLGPIDSAGREDLIREVGRAEPAGSTPIGLALNIAGKELIGARGQSGVVLISDGKEMCGGNPAAEATALASRLRAGFGMQVVGFGVKPDERASLEELARAGRGRYYDAPTPDALREVTGLIRKAVQEAAKPAPVVAAPRRKEARTVTVLRPAIQMPPVEAMHLTTPCANPGLIPSTRVAAIARYDEPARVPATVKAPSFEVWWTPKQAPGMAVRMASDLTLDEGAVAIRPEDCLGMVRVGGKGLPEAKLVQLTAAGKATDAGLIGSYIVQKSDRYGTDMVVPPGSYDLWVVPRDGGRPTMEQEGIEVKAGRVTAID